MSSPPLFVFAFCTVYLIDMLVPNTLMLTKSYLPQRVVPRDDAICMIFSDRIENVLEVTDELLGIIKYENMRSFKCVAKAYDRAVGDGKGDLLIFSPSVVRSSKRNHDMRRNVTFTRMHVYIRDKFTCQYCGKERVTRELSYDHVVPKSDGGRTNWENIVTSCYACNNKKGRRTPEEARMPLKKKPYKPTWNEIIRNDFRQEVMDARWLPYVGNYL